MLRHLLNEGALWKNHKKERVFNLNNGLTDKAFYIQSNVTQNPSVLPEIIKKKQAQTIKLSNAFPFVHWAVRGTEATGHYLQMVSGWPRATSCA